MTTESPNMVTRFATNGSKGIATTGLLALLRTEQCSRTKICDGQLLQVTLQGRWAPAPPARGSSNEGGAGVRDASQVTAHEAS